MIESFLATIEGVVGAYVMVISAVCAAIAQGLLLIPAARVSSRWGYIVYFIPFFGALSFALCNPAVAQWRARVLLASSLIAILTFVIRALIPLP